MYFIQDVDETLSAWLEVSVSFSFVGFDLLTFKNKELKQGNKMHVEQKIRCMSNRKKDAF